MATNSGYGFQGASSPAGSSAVSVVTAGFTNTDLVGGVLLINHNKNSTVVTSLMVYDPSGDGQILTPNLGDLTGLDKPNNVTIDFGGAIGAGTYTYILVIKI